MKGDHFTNMEILNTDHTGARGPSQNHRKLKTNTGDRDYLTTDYTQQRQIGASHNIFPHTKENVVW